MIILGLDFAKEEPLDLPAIRKSIDRAKVALMLNGATVFFSSLLSSLKLHINLDYPTAAVDGIHLWMNPYFCRRQTPAKLLGLMLHEVMHVVLDHCNKAAYAGLNMYVLGIAQDHYINLYLLSLGYELPDCGYFDPKYRGMSSMQIYNQLMKNPPKQPEGWWSDVLGCPEGMSEQEHHETILSNIIKAVQQAEMSNQIGTIPADILQKVEKAVNPRLPWQVILGRYLDRYNKDDYTWSLPNKRYMPDNYMPSMQSDSMEQITQGIDVSGSMTGPIFSECWQELKYVWDIMQPTQMRLQSFDTIVHHDKMYYKGDNLDDVELMGGGGTNVQPLLDSIRKEDPVFALIFTDGHFDPPNVTGINSDIYWIINSNPRFQPPIGEVIHFN